MSHSHTIDETAMLKLLKRYTLSSAAADRAAAAAAADAAALLDGVHWAALIARSDRSISMRWLLAAAARDASVHGCALRAAATDAATVLLADTNGVAAMKSYWRSAAARDASVHGCSDAMRYILAAADADATTHKSVRSTRAASKRAHDRIIVLAAHNLI
jgi:hypothetical protein